MARAAAFLQGNVVGCARSASFFMCIIWSKIASRSFGRGGPSTETRRMELNPLYHSSKATAHDKEGALRVSV